MATTVTSRRDAKPSRMGTVDTLLGLIANVTNRLRDSYGPEAGQIPLGAMSNILHELQQVSQFHDSLQYFDFERIGDNWVSHALEDILFQAGTWKLHTVPNPSFAIGLSKEQADKRIATMRDEYSKSAMDFLDRLSGEFFSRLRPSRATHP